MILPPLKPALAALLLVVGSIPATAQGLVTIGLGTGPETDGTFDAAPGGSVVAALGAAIDQLRLDGEAGGEIRFLPGTYFIDAPITIPADADGIVFTGAGAVLRASGASTGSLITVLAADVRIERLSIWDLAVVDGRRFIDVRASGFELTDVEFHFSRSGPLPVLDYQGVRVGSATGTLGSVRVSGCDFLFANPSDQAGGSPEDIIGLALEDVERILISGNRFAPCDAGPLSCPHGASPVGNGMLRRGIQIRNSRQVQIVDNSFTALGWVDALVDGTIHVEGSRRVSINGNYFENNVADHAIQVIDSDRVGISGNGMGRGFAGILVEGTSAGEGRTIIQTNEIHAVGFNILGQSVVPIVVRRRNGVSISGNKFGLCRHGQVLLEDCEDTSLVGNLFQSDDVVISDPAIQITGGRGHFALNNTAHNQTQAESWPEGVLRFQSVQPCDFYERHNNVVNPRP